MIRAVLFDMDGVLFDTETLGFQAMSRIAAELGRPIDKAFYLTTLGVPDADCRQIYLAALGQDFPYELAVERFRAYFSQYCSARTLPQKEGLGECLEGLKKRQLQIALATSTVRALVNDYFAVMPDIGTYFNALVCGGEVPNGKPAPDIYAAAARAVGCKPCECMGVEDSFYGVQSVRASGAHSVLIPDLLPFAPRFQPFVDDCLHNLNEICPLIDRLNGWEQG
jgi:HAD superfamily hydrolase (TIGR01509 family)